jgi:RNA polymerase sigma factor (sigma-70 family)
METNGASSQVSPHAAEFLKSLPVVHDVIRTVCRKGRVSPEEESEVTSSVIFKLINNDYEVFRQFEGRGALRTFLFAVVSRHLIDDRNARWGRFRPSKRARVLGSAAVYLEKLVYRDRTAIGEAVKLIANTPRWGLNSRQVRSLYARLPQRNQVDRRLEGLEEAEKRQVHPMIDAVEHREQQDQAARARQALAAALRRLPPEHRGLLHQRFQDGRSVIAIATATGRETGAMYRHFARILDHLRVDLQQQGLTNEVIRELLSHAASEFDSVIEDVCTSATRLMPGS